MIRTTQNPDKRKQRDRIARDTEEYIARGNRIVLEPIRVDHGVKCCNPYCDNVLSGLKHNRAYCDEGCRKEHFNRSYREQ